MSLYQWMSTRPGMGIALALVLAFSGPFIAFADEDRSSQVAVQAQAKIEATIFAYDGQDFVRITTTLVTEKGDSAVNTKLDHDTPAYKALIQKRSYTGDVTVFGRKYGANYAPLTSEDGRLTGALFVAVTK
ncbi:MAG: Cache 3/Cache 2 fusion domain-containing protein [Gammaproteobacteria bacterium]|nr:Cache 3/Cache 2 fusion domain-containing protein [Gammaproteobacteria bacterium]